MKIFKQKIYQPKSNSHKGKNGIITIIAGSKQYHGSALLAITIASKIVDLVYFYSTKENQVLLSKLKSGSCEFINIINNLDKYLRKSDVILIGPGMEINSKNKKLINKIICKYLNKKIILDAGALRMVEKGLLNRNIILTPHAGEFQALFNIEGTPENAEKMAKKYQCTIVLKGPQDIICNSGKLYYNNGGNAGMTKGGTGDVLAGLIAALAAKNDLLTAAFYGSFFNKKASESLFRKAGYYYNASDLVEAIPKIMKKLIK